MRILIIYHLRLGDILRCLPIAEHFHNLGNEIVFECNEEYHNLFEMVDYCTPCRPDTDRNYFDRVVDLQIWPNRYNDFRTSGKKWADYIWDLIEEGEKIPRDIHLNAPAICVPPIIQDSVLCFPLGYSQSIKYDTSKIIQLAHIIANGNPVICVGKKDFGMREFDSIETLCAYIAKAKQVVTINSAPTVICSALRSSWFHIPDSEQDDFFHINQKRLAAI